MDKILDVRHVYRFLNLAFYILLFLVVNDAVFSVSQVTLTSLTTDGFYTVFHHFWRKLNFTNVYHWLYMLTLIIAVVNLLAYIFPKFKVKIPVFMRLRFNIKLLSSPTCTSLLHFIVFAVGIYFSITSSEINKWIQKDELMSPGVSQVFASFVAILALSIVVFMLNQVAIGKHKKNEDDANQQLYREKIDDLENIIRFAPPNGFAKILSNYVDVADDFVQLTLQHSHTMTKQRVYATKLLNMDESDLFKGINYVTSNMVLSEDEIIGVQEEINETITQLEKAQEKTAEYIRCILVAYARLAALFDGITPSQKDNDIYRANLMLKYRSSDKELPDKSTFRYIPSVLLDQDNINIKHYLTLHEEHSVKVYREKTRITKMNDDGEIEPIQFQKDGQIKTFSMPFFLRTDQKNYNCFGAPRAVADAECQFINDTQEEIKQWRMERKSPSEIVDEAEVRFDKNSIAKSIIAMPLMQSRYDEIHKSSKHVMGVVNIYRDKTNLMMGNQQKQEQFEHITTPLNFALSKIVAHDMLYRYHAGLLRGLLKFAKVSSSKEDVHQEQSHTDGDTDG
ncbi:hypothetical protein ACFD7P_000890 [Vibrio vulnificus]